MNISLPILQFSLLVIMAIYLFELGLVVLLRPISIINSSWLTFAGLPLPIVNLLPFVINDTSDGMVFSQDLGMWILFVFVLTLIMVFVFYRQNYVVIGLKQTEVEAFFMEWLRSQTYMVSSRIGDKRYGQRTVKNVKIITVRIYNTDEEIWMKGLWGEVGIYADSAQGRGLVKEFCLALRKYPIQYVFKHHATAILYPLIGVGLLVFGWIEYIKPLFGLVD
ncbi:MAG: hypothetical protein H0S79_22115 [Anaerolineaceae bacterium]|nr:hypothetical protein [Anaerolineaceae bacterium]